MFAEVWHATSSLLIEQAVDPDLVSTRTYPWPFGVSGIAGGAGGVDVEIRL